MKKVSSNPPSSSNRSRRTSMAAPLRRPLATIAVGRDDGIEMQAGQILAQEAAATQGCACVDRFAARPSRVACVGGEA